MKKTPAKSKTNIGQVEAKPGKEAVKAAKELVRTAKAQLAHAKAQLKQAKVEWKRTKRNAKSKQTPKVADAVKSRKAPIKKKAANNVAHRQKATSAKRTQAAKSRVRVPPQQPPRQASEPTEIVPANDETATGSGTG